MDVEHRPNIFRDYDFAALNDPEYKEDAVREDLISPILKGMGYGPSGDHKIVRSRRLKHPFISIGSQRKKLELVPDYLLEVFGKAAWVLDAKSPSKDLDNSKHLEQAYSYAIHPEIRVPYFSLCNGQRFVLYHVSKPKLILDFNLIETAACWENLLYLLAPQNVCNYDHSLKKDFGLHLKRLGFDTFDSLVFPLLPIMSIGRISEDLFSFSAGVKPDENETYVATFDFDLKCFQQFCGKIPDKAFEILSQPLTDAMAQLRFVDAIYRVTVDCKVGNELEENEDEIFLPLRVSRLLELTKPA
ncbi:MAG: type I restriction enzyme HsdR N-terminal domain-containing protein [Planctomycetaceae bacterium]|nr:type I restriction enzyme HsdR N-terminal domain-containing protein [Planctomycetaceae bacterium]